MTCLTRKVMVVVACVACLFGFSLKLPAQSSYGSIVGTVTDSSGAVIPKAAVSITNLATSERQKTASNGSGDFQFVNLQPGNYKLDVEAAGFKHLTRSQVQVAVSVATRANAVMQVGEVGQQVVVTSEAPLLHTEDATVGQVVEGRAVSEMPLNGRNVMNVIQLAPGVVAHGQSQGQTTRSGFANYQISGGMPQEGKTELDGTPLNTGLFNGQGFSPIQDTVQEFQVMADNLPAEFGGTLDGIINLASKPGTNKFHGTAYEFLRNRVFNANTFFNNRNKIANPPFTQNQYGINGGGPIKRGKTFFYLAWEEFSQRIGQTDSFTVPTAAERAGDFSNLRDKNGNLIPIYDPATTCGQGGNPACVSGQPMRQQFPNNQIPSGRLDPTAVAMLQYWPLPKSSGATYTNANNFVVSTNIPNNRNWEHARLDQVIGSKQRMFGTFDRYINSVPPFDWYGLGINYAQGQGSDRGLLADTITLNPTTVLDLRASYSHTIFTRYPNKLGMDLSTIGWPQSYNSQFILTQLPVMSIQGMSNSDGGQTTTQSSTNISDQHAGVGYVGGSLTKIIGRHTIKTGAEYTWMPTVFGQSQANQFNFTTNFTSANPLAQAGTGFGFASYLLGLGQSGSVGNSLMPMSNLRSAGIYVDDTFQATSRLNLDLGLRWYFPGYWTERHGRATVFLPTATNPVLTAAGVNDPGDVVLVNSQRYSNGRNQNPHWHLFAPRIGATYRLSDRMVVRTGFGISYSPGPYTQYMMPYDSPIINASTTWVPTQDNGLTPVNTLSNPFPTGINPAPGRDSSYEGIVLGQSLVIPTPQNATPYIENWNIGFERQLGNSSVVDITYVGTHAVHLTMEGDGNPPGGPNINQLPDKYNSLGAQLLTKVANPFYGLVKKGPLAPATIPYGQLLLPFPQFTNVFDPAIAQFDAHYNALETKFQRRFNQGGTLLVSYTFGKNYGNADTIYGHTEPYQPGNIQDYNNWSADTSLLSFDVRNLLVVSYVLNLPFGKGEALLGAANPLVNHLVSGWGVDGVTTFQSGFPVPVLAQPTALSTNFGAGLPRPNVASGCRDSKSGSEQGRLQAWFNTACFTQPAQFGYGNEPRVDPNIRNSGIANYDFALFRNASIAEKLTVQFRAEVFNMFNRVQFGPPGNTLGTPQFGVVNKQVNNPRLLQFALRLTY